MKKAFKLSLFLLAILLAGNIAAFQEEMCGDGVCSEQESIDSCPEDCLEEQAPTGFFGLGEAGNIGATTILFLVFLGFIIYIFKRK